MGQSSKTSADGLMGVDEVAQRLNVKKSTVYELTALRKLRCYRIGTGRGTIRVSEEQLQDYLLQSEQGEPFAPPRAPVKLKHLS